MPFPNLPNRFLLRLGLPLALLLAGGCQTPDRVTVDALSRPAAVQSTSYRLITTNPEIDPTTLRHKEAERLVKAAMAARGLYEAPDPAEADMIVTLDYGMGEPQSRIETTSRPEFTLTSGGSYPVTVRVGTAADGRPIYQTVYVYEPPRYVYSGEYRRDYMVTTYEKFLSLSARENRSSADRPAEEIWTVAVTSEGESDDFRKALPLLAAAAIDYIGTETNGVQTVRIDEDDGAVEFVRSVAAE